MRRKLFFIPLIIGMMPLGCTTFTPRIPIDPTLQNSTEVLPIQSDGKLLSSTLRFGEFTAAMNSFSNEEDSTIGFSSLFKESYTKSFHYFVLSANGSRWNAQCASQTGAIHVGDWDFSKISDQTELCGYAEVGKKVLLGQLQIEWLPPENWKSPITSQAQFMITGKSVVEFKSIQQDENGRVDRQVLGFDILINNQRVGAIQGFLSKDAKIWMPKDITPEQRTAIALATPALLLLESPNDARHKSENH